MAERPMFDDVQPLSSFNKVMNTLLLTDVLHGDIYSILFVVTIFAVLVLAQKCNLFTRPPPVPTKRLPRRPILQVLFTPDGDAIGTATTVATVRNNRTAPSSSVVVDGGSHEEDGISVFTEDDSTPLAAGSTISQQQSSSRPRKAANHRQQQSNRNTILHGLPDSFAPLLSSSEMEVITTGITADLIHAVQIQAQIRFRPGRHIIPLDKDERRPQFWFDSKDATDIIMTQGENSNDDSSTKKGCKVSASVTVGSERFSLDEDLDTTRRTESRSRPMVKGADLIFDPPLRLGNVAPTLLHFPTLFEDRALPKLRRMQVVGFIIEYLASMWYVLEKFLWMIESKCQIHVGRVKATPIFRGTVGKDGTYQWRLSLSFTGHALLFDWIPIPFISVQLPSFIIPQPHALLEFLMTKQPLASARLRRENISDEKITVAALNALDTWSINVKAVATPPAVEVDLTLSGGITLSFEMMHGRDATNLRKDSPPTVIGVQRNMSDESLNTWVTNHQSVHPDLKRKSIQVPEKMFDSNSLTPWYLETSIDGSVSDDKIVLNVSRCLGRHEDEYADVDSTRSMFTVSGSVILSRANETTTLSDRSPASTKGRHKRSLSQTVKSLSPPIHALLLFPKTYVPTSKTQSGNHLIEYDYAFDIGEETNLDAVSLSYGASHPMLKGGTIISCVLESIYAHGSIFAREGSIADPSEMLRKRNILRHLPAVDFTAGIQNTYLPKQSVNYLDDGNTRSLPEMDGGRVMIRVLGGVDESATSDDPLKSSVLAGIKFRADFGVSSFSLASETKVNEFPELEIFEGSRMCSFILGTFDGSATCHLRPQQLTNGPTSSLGPNVFNPLEAYEIDFKGSSIALRLKEATFNLDHRRIIVPTETAFAVKVQQSVVNMMFEGTTQCELAWDFQGSSPVLQTTPPGQTPAQSSHEDRQQAYLLIKPLCQGRLNLEVSSVGGISFRQASTTREDKQGLYDWKFFNAIVAPDDDSPARIMDVLHDKKTMNRLLEITKLINADIERAIRYILTKLWRAREIIDKEGIEEPGQIIPGYKMARLMSLFLSDDDSQVREILPIIRRVVAGNGLDVIKAKELLRKHVEAYDDWAAEIDRSVKWAAVMLGPANSINQPIEDMEVPPLSECIDPKRYEGIPTAKELYQTLQDKPMLPLDQSFSNLMSRVAPYMTLHQIDYMLHLRPSSHWQPFDLKRLRYVYSVKKKVQEISECYGGLSFMPQSFFVSVFLGEATRSSLRAAMIAQDDDQNNEPNIDAGIVVERRTALSTLRQRTFGESMRLHDDDMENFIMSPAGRVASSANLPTLMNNQNDRKISSLPSSSRVEGLLGDSLLGPQDIAILLQAGLASAMKGSTVVQLNQRMLLDLMASQPKSFAIGVLAELGSDGPRGLAGALMALCDLDQGSFKDMHRIDMHNLLESWLPGGLKIPKREDYLAGGRWARQSFYDAMYSIAVSILDLSETYTGLKLRIQQVRHNKETDPLELRNQPPSKLSSSIDSAAAKISMADELGQQILNDLRKARMTARECSHAISVYKEAFVACSQVLSIDRLAFQAPWFKSFYRRNYDALMVKSIYDNVMDDVDNVRIWMEALRRGSNGFSQADSKDLNRSPPSGMLLHEDCDPEFKSLMSSVTSPVSSEANFESIANKPFFTCPERQEEQNLIDEIIDAIFYDKREREALKSDPLVRLLISNEPGYYNFTIVSAMGVITDGKKGLELQDAIERLEKERGVKWIRADTGTARSIDYNATKIAEAVEIAVKLKRPYGLIGYSQGCANELNFESRMISGTPDQQSVINSPEHGLVCRQLLFSAANGSIHGPAVEVKAHQLITMCEDFFKYQQGFFSRAFISSTLEVINGILDSSAFQKSMGAAKSFLPDAVKAFWREAQTCPHIPTCVLRGVLENHTTPESLDLLCNMMTKQSGSALHDSQVHVYDAVGHPVYVRNRNARILKKTDMGGSIQRTHHWSPLSDEVEYVRTTRDIQHAVFDCAKDRHIFPWCDVNARFGIIHYSEEKSREIAVEINSDVLGVVAEETTNVVSSCDTSIDELVL